MNSCEYCGKPCNNKFCSISCRNKIYNKICKPHLNVKPIERIDYKFNCNACQKEYTINMTVKKYNGGKYIKTCSRSCSNKRAQTEETKLKIKKANKKILSKPCKWCSTHFDNCNKVYCTEECKRLAKKHYYEFGFPNKDKMKSYRIKCKFKFSVYSFPELFDLSLIEKFGFYSPSNKKNNLTGISLDHKYSIRDGYDNDVDPNIMSHVMNCQILEHKDNLSKGKKSSITLDQLMEKIKSYENK